MATHKIAKISVSVVDGISVWRRNDSTTVYCCGVSGLVCEKTKLSKLFENASLSSQESNAGFLHETPQLLVDTLHE